MFITFVRRYERPLVLLGLVGISLLVAYDIVVDLSEGLPFEHVFHETVILGFAVFLTIFQLRVISRQRITLAGKAKEIDELKASREDFRRRATRFSADFSTAVTEQFTAWGLTESERDIAILLVKGLSMKEIADLRHSKEATVRQQATAVYRKAKVEGRQELASYFLEDLFDSPQAPR